MVPEDLVDETADAAQDTEDDATTLSQSEIRAFITRRINNFRSDRRDALLRGYQTGQLSRRDFLKIVGVIGASGIAGTAGIRLSKDGMTGLTGRQTAGDTSGSGQSEVIKVPAGETFTEQSGEFTLEDGGTWANKLIDITADGAGIHLNLDHLRNWKIGNIGVKGVNDSGEAAIWAATEDPDGKLLLENIYLGDGMGYSGSGDSVGTHETGPGIFVDPDHAGDITINRVNVQKFANNGIYASGPGKGKSKASHGNVVIKNSFAKGNDVSCFRLAEGKDESRFENCVALSSDSARGFWAENGSVRAVNCDSSGNNQQYCVGSSDSRATLHIENCRADNDEPIATWDVCTSGTFDGEFGSNPRTQPPEGVPTTPEEAACINA